MNRIVYLNIQGANVRIFAEERSMKNEEFIINVIFALYLLFFSFFFANFVPKFNNL